MPAQRKPSKLLERAGRFRHDPQRRRRDVPGVGLLPAEAPAALRLDSHGRAAWRQIAAAIPTGLGTASDAITVELAARLLAQIRRTKRHTAANVSQLRALLNSLGLSLAARASLGVGDGGGRRNPFARFGAER